MQRRSALGTALVGAATALCTTALILAATPAVGQAATRAAHAKKAPVYYLSLGDSYSVGYQPATATTTSGATAGYTAVVAKKEHMQLENFGCGGATTSSIVTAIGCTESGYGPVAAIDPVPYPTETQEQAALDFIAAHPGQVGLVTVSIGGNDVTSCANAGSTAAILGCVESADSAITTNVGGLVSELSTALTTDGDTAKIVGLTYPDVILGDWVYPAATPNQSLASLSVTAFDDLINPALQGAYTSVPNGTFVNVTQAPWKKATAGDDTPTTTTQKLKPYGVVPSAVAEICKLTYFCTQGNIHANTKGYKFIGKLVVASLVPAT